MSFYIPIDNPKDVQKTALIASKKVIGVLKKYEDYRKLRAEKLDYILKFKKVLDDLGVLNKKLSTKMPKPPGQAKLKPKEPVEKKKVSALERELADIEKRLKTLDS